MRLFRYLQLGCGGVISISRIKKDDKLRTLNQRNEQLIGQTTILQEALVSGSGRVNLGDTTWAVRCNEDLPAGTKIVVIDVEGIILVVEAC